MVIVCFWAFIADTFRFLAECFAIQSLMPDSSNINLDRQKWTTLLNDPRSKETMDVL